MQPTTSTGTIPSNITQHIASEGGFFVLVSSGQFAFSIERTHKTITIDLLSVILTIMSSTQSHNTSSSSESEISPLVAPVTGAESNGNFYFLNRGESFKSATQELPGVVEKLPYGATENEFASRPVVVSFKL